MNDKDNEAEQSRSEKELAVAEIPVPEAISPALQRGLRLGEQLAFMANYFSRTQVTQADELRELRGFRDLVDQLAYEVLGCSCCSLDDGPGSEAIKEGRENV
jgi:hypothetical protein